MFEFSDSYLADGSVRSAVSHHDVGVKINVVYLHWSRTDGHCSGHLTTNTLRGT